MARKNWSEIREAADACLILCLNSDAPQTKLSNYIETLKANGWDEESIETMESEVLDAFEFMRHSELVTTH
jgi:hypothetical protein